MKNNVYNNKTFVHLYIYISYIKHYIMLHILFINTYTPIFTSPSL